MTEVPYEIDVRRRVLFAVVSGPVTEEAAACAVSSLMTDPAFAPDLRGFVNLRFWTAALPSVSELQQLTAACSPILTLPVRRRCALLVRTREAEARARVFERMTSGTFVQFRAFTDDHAANTWLGLENGTEPWHCDASLSMTTPDQPPPALPDVFYVAVAELPANFEHISAWVEAVVREHAHMLGLRGLIDCSQLISRVPPSVEYLTQLVHALRPLMDAARGTRCALLVPNDPLLWRARIFESLTSASRIHFRAFQDKAEAFAWLARDENVSPNVD